MRTAIGRTVLTALLLGWMGVIFSFSAQPAKNSAVQSRSVVNAVVEFISRFTEAEKPDEMDLRDAENIIRKAAHFFTYFVLGILAASSFYAFEIKKFLLWALVFCVLYAVSDEVHQYFVPGRSMQLSDVILDAAGSACGVLLWRIYFKKQLK